ncbi:MAG: hypothetical protein WCS72_08845 [Deltaproteobacteria bacterium]
MRRWLMVLGALSVMTAGTVWADDPAPAAPPAAAAPAAKAAPAPATPVEDLMVGEVVTLPYNRSAAYGPSRVRGPGINLTDTGTGEWKGNIKDLGGVFRVTEKRISGGNVNLVMERDADGWTCQGTVDGNRVHLVMNKDGFAARYGTRLYDMKRVSPDLWATIPTGPAVRVKGDAQGYDPYYPQFIFALLAVL